jgi:restriction system protein
MLISGTEIFMAQSNTTVLAALIGLIAFMAVLTIAIDFFLRRRRERRVSRMDELEGHDFEFFCADLLQAQGFIDVEVTRGSGDFGVDILAEKDGVTYAVQCKRYSGPVGVEAVLRTYGGQAYYERMVGAVMTNQYFTSPAVEAAKKLHILLWDRGYMDTMIEESSPRDSRHSRST